MDFLLQKIEQILRHQKKWKKWQKVVVSLACIVVFITTYALILPAITMDRDEAKSQGGIFWEESQDAEETVASADEQGTSQDGILSAEQASLNAESDMDEEYVSDGYEENSSDNYKSDTAAVEEQVGTDISGEENSVEEGSLNPEAVSERPAATFDEVAGDVTVHVEAPEGAFPAGTTMKVEPVAEEQVIDAVQEAVEESVTKVSAVDIIFLDVLGNEIEPKAEIRVSMSSSVMESVEQPVIVHVDEEGVAETVESEQVDGSVVFESDRFSVYVLVETETIEQEITITSPEGEEFTYVVSVTYDSDAEIPEDAKLRVVEYAQDSDEYKSAYKEIISFKTSTIDGFAEEGMGFDALDISILDENGQIVEPKAPVHVNITRKKLPDGIGTEKLAKTIEVQHIVNNKLGEKYVEIVASPNIDENTVGIIEETVVIDFSVDSFSTYTLTWGNVSKTVHYGYLEEGIFHEFNNGEEGSVTLRPPTRYGDQLDLEKEISDYRYVTTRINNATTGRQISPLLLTDPPYKSNVQNAYTNASLSAHPNYNVAVANYNFTARWRYRQLSSLTWNPCNDNAWNATTRWSSRVTSIGVTKPVTFSNSETDIYVVYEKGSNSVIPSDDSENIGSLSAPSTNKDVNSNGDGTYDVTLSVTGESRNVSEKTKANIVIVLDTSWSMYFDLTGKDNSYTGNTSRMQVAKAALGSVADKLFAMNADDADTIEIAFITFAQRVRNEEEMNTIYSGTDASAFKTMINGLDCASGTNWDDALYAANSIHFDDNDPTYVVFITDGDPISCAHPYGTYSDWDGGTYYNGRTNYQYALAAKNQADKIIAANKTLYTIGAFGSVTNLQAIGGTYLGQANSSETINSYFDDIVNEIRRNLGYSDVTISDGITAMTSTDMLNGEPGSFRYYRSGGKNGDGTTPKYSTTANDGLGEEWTSIPDSATAYLLEVKSEEGNTKYYKNGTEVVFSALQSELPEAEFLEKYPVGTKTVLWNIDLGKDSSQNQILLEDGVTYTVAFTVWPSQEAYDLVADLNNGIKVFEEGYSNSITEEERAQVVEVTAPTALVPGSYSLKTNTTATVDYTAIRLENGTPVGDPTTGSAIIKDPNGQMTLDTEIITVRKAFEHNINSQDPFDALRFYLKRDGEYYLMNGTTTSIKPGAEGSSELIYYTMDLPKNPLPSNATEDEIASYWDASNWSYTTYVAPGLMKDGEVLEPGHNYTLYEEILKGKPYEYQFTPQIIRPMNISSVNATYLTLKDDFNIPSETAVTYSINDNDGTYSSPGSGSSVYYAERNSSAELVGTNRKTAELDITKIIDDQTGEMTTAEKNAETFTYKVTFTVPATANTAGITANEYVPRYNDQPSSTRYTIFGYRESDLLNETSGIQSDYDRFKDKIYGAYTVTDPEHPANDYTINCMFKLDEGGDTKTAVIYLTLKQLEIIRFTNLPLGTEYKIEEVYANLLHADPARNVDATEAANAGRSNNIADQGYTVTSVYKNGTRSESGAGIIKGTVVNTDLDNRLYNQFTNIRTSVTNDVYAEFKVKKVVDGYEWGSEYYNMRLTAGTAEYTDLEGGTATSPMPGLDSVNIYNDTDSHTLSFGNVLYTRPGVYKYTVSEYNNSANMPYVVFADPVEVTVTVTADNNGKLHVTEVTDNSGIENNSVLIPATQTSLDTVLTTMTNTSKPIDIVKVSGKTGNVIEGAVFEIHQGSEKLYFDGNGQALSAEQVLSRISPDGSITDISSEAAIRAMTGQGIKSTITIGEMSLKGLAVTGYTYTDGQFIENTPIVYELVEIKAADGFMITENNNYFKVAGIRNTNETTRVRYTGIAVRLTDADGHDLVDGEGNPKTTNKNVELSDNAMTITLENAPGAELPHTGGSGKLPYTLSGMILIFISALMYGFRMRRRERRSS